MRGAHSTQADISRKRKTKKKQKNTAFRDVSGFLGHFWRGTVEARSFFGAMNKKRPYKNDHKKRPTFDQLPAPGYMARFKAKH